MLHRELNVATQNFIRHRKGHVETTKLTFFTAADVAARYLLGTSAIRQWRRIGYGPKGVRVGGRILYPEDEVVRFERSLGLDTPSTSKHRTDRRDHEEDTP